MNQVPFFDIGRLNATIASELDAASRRALTSGWYILGRECEAFERGLADSLGGVTAAGCNSGTDALVLSLLAAGVGPGDEVITVAHTAIPTVAAICATGAVPVLIDVEPDTWLMAPDRIAEALSPRTKAVIAVHLYGNMVDVDAIQAELHRCGQTDVALIEDVAQAHGARLQGRYAGTIGRFGAFSFYPSKNIGALGDGGAVCARGAEDAGRLKVLRNYGQQDRYHATAPRGINSRLDEVQAAMLAAKLPHLETWNNRKSELIAVYRRELAGLPFDFQALTPRCEPAWHLCVIACHNSLDRDRLQEHLKESGVQSIIHYPIPCHRQPAFAAARCMSLPVTEALCARILSLPFSPVLKNDEQAYVIRAIRSYFG